MPKSGEKRKINRAAIRNCNTARAIALRHPFSRKNIRTKRCDARSEPCLFSLSERFDRFGNALPLIKIF